MESKECVDEGHSASFYGRLCQQITVSTILQGISEKLNIKISSAEWGSFRLLKEIIKFCRFVWFQVNQSATTQVSSNSTFSLICLFDENTVTKYLTNTGEQAIGT